MDIDSRAPAPEGAINWVAPNRLGFPPMPHRRAEPLPIEATPQAIRPLPTRRGMPR